MSEKPHEGHFKAESWCESKQYTNTSPGAQNKGKPPPFSRAPETRTSPTTAKCSTLNYISNTPSPFFFFFTNKVSQGCPGWPWTCHLPASAFWAAGISGLCHLAQWSSFSPVLQNEDPFRCVPHSYNPRIQCRGRKAMSSKSGWATDTCSQYELHTKPLRICLKTKQTKLNEERITYNSLPFIHIPSIKKLMCNTYRQ